MISYCKNLHQIQLETKHQNLCGEDQNLFKSSEWTNLFNFLRRMEDPSDVLTDSDSCVYPGDISWRPVCSKLQVQSGLILHIIGIQNLGEGDFENYEVLLHLIPQLKNLKIVVVGEELEQSDKLNINNVGICEKCVTENKTLNVEMIKLSYASYVGSEYFATPHLIIAYNSGESGVYMWAESLLKMVKIQVPFVETTDTKLRAETEHDNIRQLFGYLTCKSSYEKNPFASKRPYRDAGKGGLILENSYIADYFLYESWTDEQTNKMSLQKKKEALQNELSDDSHNSLNSDKNIEQSLESNPGNKDAGERNSKQKKQKKENHALNPAKENSLFDKEEDLKDTKDKDISEILDSQSNATEMSNELLDDHFLDPPGENQENDEKEDDLVDKGESGIKVSSSDKETGETSGKSSTEEQRSKSENEKEESKPKSEENAEKSGNSSAGSSSSQLVSRVDAKSSSKVQNISENKETLKDQPAESKQGRSRKSPSPRKNPQKLQTIKDKSTGAKMSETSMSVALDARIKSEDKIQEQKEESNKSKEKKNKKSNEQEEAKDEGLPDAVTDKMIEKLEEENSELESEITKLADELNEVKGKGKNIVCGLILDISSMKKVMERFEGDLNDALKVYDNLK